MSEIFIVLMHSMTIPARIVKLATRYKYSHVAISLEENCDTLYSFGRKKVNNALDGGYSVENRNGDFFKKFKNATCTVYKMKVPNEKKENLEKLLISMKENDVYKYDFVGAFFRFFKIPVTFKNQYTCSYFVAHALKETGIYDFEIPPHFVNPKDFEKIQMLEKIYEGKYLDM